MARLFRIGTDGEEDAGKSEKLLKSLGIEIRKSATEFKSFDTILQEINAKWNTWGSITKDNVSQTIAGVYHYSKFIALMDNMSIATEATNKANASFSSAMSENIKQLESINGQLGILKVRIESVYKALISDELLKSILGGLNLALERTEETLDRISKFDLGDLWNTIKKLAGTTIFEVGKDAFNSDGVVSKDSIDGMKQYSTLVEKLKKELSDINNIKPHNIAKIQNEFLKLGYSANEVDKIIADITKSLQEDMKESVPPVEKTVLSFKNMVESVDTAYDSLSNLASAYESLNNGESLSLDNIKNLAEKYPTLAKYISETNDLTFNRGKILKQVWEIEKTIETKRLNAQKEQLNKELKLQEAMLAKTDFTALMAGIDSPEIKTIRDQIKYVNALLNLYNSDIGDFNSSKSSKSKTDIYTAEINQFQKLEDALASLNSEIERNKILSDQSEGQQQNDLLEKRVELLKRQQSIMHDLNEERRNAIQSNINKLSGYGFDISYDRNTNNLSIQNMERINQLKGKDTESTNKLRKEIEDLVKETIDLNSANREASNQWHVIEKDISDITTTLNDFYKKLRETRISIENDVLSALEETYKKQIDAYKDVVDEEKKLIQDRYQTEIDSINRLKELNRRNFDQKKYVDDQKARYEELAKLQQRYIKVSADNSREGQKEQFELEQEISKLRKEITDNDVERTLKVTEDGLDDQIDLLQTKKDIELKALEDSLEAQNQVWLSKQNELLKQSYDKYWQAKEGLLNIGKQIEEIMGGSQDSILTFLKNNTQKFKDATYAQGQAMLEAWQEKLGLIKGEHEERLKAVLDFLTDKSGEFGSKGFTAGKNFVDKLIEQLTAGNITLDSKLQESINKTLNLVTQFETSGNKAGKGLADKLTESLNLGKTNFEKEINDYLNYLLKFEMMSTDFGQIAYDLVKSGYKVTDAPVQTALANRLTKMKQMTPEQLEQYDITDIAANQAALVALLQALQSTGSNTIPPPPSNGQSGDGSGSQTTNPPPTNTNPPPSNPPASTGFTGWKLDHYESSAPYRGVYHQYVNGVKQIHPAGAPYFKYGPPKSPLSTSEQAAYNSYVSQYGQPSYDTGFYDKGGELLDNGVFPIRKDTKEPERILDPQQTKDFNSLVKTLPNIIPTLDSIQRMLVPSIPKFAFAGNNAGVTQTFKIDVNLNGVTIANDMDINKVVDSVGKGIQNKIKWLGNSQIQRR
jgi:hypothetical protein